MADGWQNFNSGAQPPVGQTIQSQGVQYTWNGQGWIGPGGTEYYQGSDGYFHDTGQSPSYDSGGLKLPGFNGSGGGSTGPYFTDNYGQQYSEGEYRQLVAQFQHLGATYGEAVSPEMAREMLKQGNDPSEAAQKFQEVQAINSSAQRRAEFQKVMDYYNVKGDVSSFDGALKWVTGQADAQFYKLWDQYAATAAASGAGFSVVGDKNMNPNHDLRLDRSQLEDFQKSLNLDPTQVNIGAEQTLLQQGAQTVVQTLPGSRYKHYGLDKVEALKVGAGVGTADASMKVQRIINEEKGFEQVRAHPAWQKLQQNSNTGQQSAL